MITDRFSIANAAQLFPDIVKTHLDHHDEKIAKPAEIFAVITEVTKQASDLDKDNSIALLTYGSPMARKTAATSMGSSTIEGALRGLLRGLSQALWEMKPEKYSSMFRERHYWGESVLIAADLLPASVNYPSAKLVPAIPGCLWEK